MRKILLAGLLIPALALGGAGCSGKKDADESGTQLGGSVHIDGSSTVFPITEAVGEEFQMLHRGVRVTVGISGTGGGFKKFCSGETDINDASRPIKEKEALLAAERGIGFIEIPVAFDGISVVVNPANDWVDRLTVAELHQIWMPDSPVKTWRDVRPAWPNREIKLYGPDVDSGTFDYFTETINGESQVSRPDYTASADDNVLVTGVAGDRDALGYFGYAYYAENTDRLKVVPIDGGGGPVTPSHTTINNGTYAPLSRPLFLYVSTKGGERPEVREFVKFYLQNAATLAAEVGYVGLPARAYELGWQRFESGKTGSIFNTDKARSGLSIVELLSL
jgi:phosphate transport system substrate-binding protein